MHDYDQKHGLGHENGDAAVDESGEFLGRAVWFHCKKCGRIQIPQRMVTSREAWEEESVALLLYNLDPQEVWWFESLCGYCEPTMSLPTRPPGLQLLFLSDGRKDDPDKSERIVVYKTNLIRLLSYRLGKGSWLPKALILSSIAAREPSHLICDDSIPLLPTRAEANALAKKLATEWIDSFYSSFR
jgi:hypothetical protein